MKKHVLTAASLAIMLLTASGAAQATPYAVTYSFTASLGVYPSDDPPSGNQYQFSDAGKGVIDLQNTASVISGTKSQLAFGPGFVELSGNDPAQFSFAVDQQYDDFTPLLGVQTFNFSLADVVAYQYAYINIIGGTGLAPDRKSLEQGFDKLPTFSVTGSFIVSEVGTVPLPSSAPMFGVALLALGVAGYGMKRTRVAAAD